MPELLNYWCEQLSYHKILPLEYNLSIKISCGGQSRASPRRRKIRRRAFWTSPLSPPFHPSSPLTVCD